MPGGPEHLRPDDELTTRLCYVNFDGTEPLAESRRRGLDSELNDSFVKDFCSPVYHGITVSNELLYFLYSSWALSVFHLPYLHLVFFTFFIAFIVVFVASNVTLLSPPLLLRCLFPAFYSFPTSNFFTSFDGFLTFLLFFYMYFAFDLRSPSTFFSFTLTAETLTCHLKL